MQIQYTKILAIFTILIGISVCLSGIDTSDFHSTSTYQCIHSNANLFAIIKVTTNNGSLIGNAHQNLYNAAAGGLLTDILFTPCRRKSAISQVD